MSEVRCPYCEKLLCEGLDGQAWWTCPGCKRSVHINTRRIAKKPSAVIG